MRPIAFVCSQLGLRPTCCELLLALAAALPLGGCSSLTQPEEILIAPEPPKPKPPPAAAPAPQAASDGPARPMGKAGGG